MRLRFKARRIPGKDAITFKNPHGEPVYLKNIGDISNDLDPGFAHSLLGQFGDILEPVINGQDAPRHEVQTEEKMIVSSPEHKAVVADENRASGLRRLRQKGFTQPSETNTEVTAEVTTEVPVGAESENKQSE